MRQFLCRRDIARLMAGLLFVLFCLALGTITAYGDSNYVAHALNKRISVYHGYTDGKTGEERYFAFKVIIQASCNDNYDAPQILNVSGFPDDKTAYTLDISESLSNNTGKETVICLSAFTAELVGQKMTSKEDGSKTVTAEVYITWTVTTSQKTLLGAASNPQTFARNAVTYISCAVQKPESKDIH
jgi:hypothetical protein